MTVFGAPADPADRDFYDIDAELAWASGRVASMDRTESPDAALVACNASRELGILAFAGAGKGGAVVVVHAQTELPVEFEQSMSIWTRRVFRGGPVEIGGLCRDTSLAASQRHTSLVHRRFDS